MELLLNSAILLPIISHILYLSYYIILELLNRDSVGQDNCHILSLCPFHYDGVSSETINNPTGFTTSERVMTLNDRCKNEKKKMKQISPEEKSLPYTDKDVESLWW